jgi:hypothetical protein
MQACHNEAISGRCSTVSGAPSSRETLKRSVGPMRRITQYPAQMIVLRTILWRRVKRRVVVVSAAGDLVLTSGTEAIVNGGTRARGNHPPFPLRESPCQ